MENLRPVPTKPITKEEFAKKWGRINIHDILDDRKWNEKHLKIYLDDLYSMYETTGFTETYEFPLFYDDKELEHYGMKYDIIRRATMEEFTEWPSYLIRFENGDEQLVEADMIALAEENRRKDWFEQQQREFGRWPEDPKPDPTAIHYRKLYESVVEQNEILKKLITEKDKEIEEFRKAIPKRD